MDQEQQHRKRLIIMSCRRPEEEETAEDGETEAPRGQALWRPARDGGDNNGLRNKWLYRLVHNCPKQTAPNTFNKPPVAAAAAASRRNPEGQQWTPAEPEERKIVKGTRRRRVNLIRTTILLIIGYELLAELTNRHANYPPNFLLEPTDRSCQRCLPNVVFRSCVALDELTNRQQEASTMGPAVGAPEMIRNDSSSTTTMPPLATSANQIQPSPNNNNSNANLEPNHNHNRNLNHNHNHNVLCNSRCSCVLLEPIEPNTGSSANPQPMVAFDEDYSVDYEEAVALGNETTGGGSPERQPNSGSQEQVGAGGGKQPESQPVAQPTILPISNTIPGTNGKSRFQAPSGSGRDLNGPQLYAQSLYSGQAPKLALHAHTLTPSGKSAAATSPLPVGPHASQQDLAPQMQAPLSAGPQNYSPFPHSLRSNYLAHHLRAQANINKSNISSNGLANNSQLPSRLLPRPENFATISLQQQQRLVPLKPLDYAAKLINHTAALYASTSGGGQASYNSSGKQQWQVDNDFTPGTAEQQIQNLNWTEAPKLIDQVEALLRELDRDDIQSLSLSHNDLRFELWSELYALLAGPLRQHLYHLNLSHNNLVKLGVTFTGYLEHHLALHNNSWPFGSAPYGGGGGGGAKQGEASTGSEFGRSAATKPGNQQGSSMMRLKHTLLGAGKLYSIVQGRLQSELRQAEGAPVLTGTATNDTSNRIHHHHGGLLQQPMLLRALDLSHNKLKWLINDQFRTLKHLQTIRLDHNRIRYIHQHAFSGLESLRFLNLNFNRLQVIYIEQFQTNYNLLALMLRANSLAYLRGGSFSSLASLKRLDLSQNKLTIMSSNAFVGLESLELLNCSSNQFVHAPSASLHPLTSLRQLDLNENFITQLAPGTFFHLPLEELWLERNEQLVAIERGAFWDLPYLKRLHLNMNPMLMSVNSQAFVGTQSLQAIGVEGCQSLDGSTRQMLDNVTLAATSRLLRHEQLAANKDFQQAATSASGGEQPAGNSSSNKPAGGGFAHKPVQPVVYVQPVAHINRFAIDEPGGSGSGSFNYKQLGDKLNYASYLATLALLVVVLKLIFKFTSSSRYLEARRRRRRVYEEGGSFEVTSVNEGKVADEPLPLEMCEQVIFAGESSPSGSGGTSYEVYGQPEAAAVAPLPPVELASDNNAQEEAEKEPEGSQLESVIAAEECPGEPAAALETLRSACDCPDCPPGVPAEALRRPEELPEGAGAQQPPSSPRGYQELLERQFLAAGLDYGHANCAHFYQSLQLADYMDFYP